MPVFNENYSRRVLEVKGIVGKEQDELIRSMCLEEFSKIVKWFVENNGELEKIAHHWCNDFYRVYINDLISFFDSMDYYPEEKRLAVLIMAYRQLKTAWNLPLKELESFNKWIQEERPRANSVVVATVARYSGMIAEAFQNMDNIPELNKYCKVVLLLQEAKQKGLLK